MIGLATMIDPLPTPIQIYLNSNLFNINWYILNQRWFLLQQKALSGRSNFSKAFEHSITGLKG
jgi:hypothetical protein